MITADIVKRMDECLIPDEKAAIIQFLGFYSGLIMHNINL